jgi:hypothetical protein
MLTKERIERLHNRVMNLRDRTPTPSVHDLLEEIENQYVAAYRRAYRSGNVGEFVEAARRYQRLITCTKRVRWRIRLASMARTTRKMTKPAKLSRAECAGRANYQTESGRRFAQSKL